MLAYLLPEKRTQRRTSSLDTLTICDKLMAAPAVALARGRAPVNDATLSYYARKRLAVRAAYYLQRYGRDFYARAPIVEAVIGTARDAAARDLGYTRSVYIDGGMEGGEFLIAPDTDLDSQFKAWAVDWQEFTMVSGWNVLIEERNA